MAGTVCVLALRGEATALALAEAEALGFQTDERHGRLALGCRTDDLSVAAGIDAVLDGGGLLAWTTNDAFVASVVERWEPPEGRVCVRVERFGGRMKDSSTQSIARSLGGHLSDMGRAIDLDRPEHVLRIVLDATSLHAGWGWDVPRSTRLGVGARRAGERPFFRPVSLDPNLARTAVNLANGSRDGVLLDAMTGTGGFLIEGALTGRETVGMDLDPMMVDGAKANLEWAVDGEAHRGSVVLGDATSLATSLPASARGRITGLVLDPPYGRNSHGSHGPWELLARVLASTANEASPEGAGCCLILPIAPVTTAADGVVDASTKVEPLHGAWEDVLDLFETSAWSLRPERWSVRVHGSLARLILHATCAPPS
ncbi:MAG: hypothetical protein ACPGOT_07200 [Candidatus Poseidoniaceae archaeon]